MDDDANKFGLARKDSIQSDLDDSSDYSCDTLLSLQDSPASLDCEETLHSPLSCPRTLPSSSARRQLDAAFQAAHSTASSRDFLRKVIR